VTATAVRGARLIDGTGRGPIDGVTVLADETKIVAVGPDSSIDVPRDAKVVDAQGLTLIPGMVDCHVHVTVKGFNLSNVLSTPPSLRLLECVPILHHTLQAGFTTVRDAGGAPAGVKMAVDNGVIPGPRLQVSVTVLSQTGGHGDFYLPSCVHVPLTIKIADVPDGVVDGVEPMRQRVREILRAGADWIKLCTTGGVLSPTDAPSATQFTVEEIEAAVSEAKAHGEKFCMAHAQGAQGVKNALRAGVKSIEHGIWLDEEALALMKERSAYLVPTLVAPVQVLRQAEQNPGAIPAWAVDKARTVVKDHQESFRRAVEAGVKIAMGTDSGVGPHGENAEELVLMARHGMSPMQALMATTSRAAELLGMANRIGTVEVGKLADLVLVDGDPLDDLGVLQDRNRLVMVMKDGQLHKNLVRPAVPVG
jgi:imidazolonepropionase-like amidohydrolase